MGAEVKAGKNAAVAVTGGAVPPARVGMRGAVSSDNSLATRRRFLAGLFAGAGSAVLAACGGGSTGSSVTGTGTSTANASMSQRAAATATLSESASGTTVPSASYIVDGNLVKWTLSSGAVLRAGANTGCPVTATLILYYNHTIYAANSAGAFYINQNNVWSATQDPRESSQGTIVPPAASLIDGNGVAWTLNAGTVYRKGVNTYCPVLASWILYWNHTVYAEDASGLWYVNQAGSWLSTYDPRESASGTTVPPSSAITDGVSIPWTLSNGAVLRNGVNTGCPVAASLVLYWNHTIYACDASGHWYINQANVWSASSDPRNATSSTVANAAASSALFYGMNGHMAWTSGIYKTMTAAQQVAILQDLGVTNYRADVADSGMAQTVANALNGAFKGSGISILPCINPMNWDQTSSESTSYAYGYQLAQSIAQVLKGLVSVIECGNELDANGVESTGAGNSPADYNPAYWPAFRGVIRGMIDGVKSVDPTIKCGVNVGIPLDYTALQMLWNGQTPNGTATPTSGATPLQWDVTMYHWYETSGDIVRAGSQGLTNVLQILATSFGKPIWITEWGYYTGDTAANQAAYVSNTLKEYYSLRNTYNLQAVFMYELIDMGGGDDFGVLLADGVTHKSSYAAYKNFTAANAV